MKSQVNNIKPLKQFRKELRNNLTRAEAALWELLKKRKLEGRKFRRQHSVGPYILDFYCPNEKLAIELDGPYHFTDEVKKNDEERTKYIEEYGIRVLRFENDEVFNTPRAVLEKIKANFKTPLLF